jgi:hypothetical protein
VRGQRHAPARLYPRKDPVPIVQEAGWAPGPFWTGAENLAPTGIQSLDRPARSQLLYRLRYPAHKVIVGNKIFTLLHQLVVILSQFNQTLILPSCRPKIWLSSRLFPHLARGYFIRDFPSKFLYEYLLLYSPLQPVRRLCCIMHKW